MNFDELMESDFAKNTTLSEVAEAISTPFSDSPNSLAQCCFCGKQFAPWKDECGDFNNDACRPCDASYEQGQLNDREFGDN